jgi:hypothetical protein
MFGCQVLQRHLAKLRDEIPTNVRCVARDGGRFEIQTGEPIDPQTEVLAGAHAIGFDK